MVRKLLRGLARIFLGSLVFMLALSTVKLISEFPILLVIPPAFIFGLGLILLAHETGKKIEEWFLRKR